MGRGRKGEEKLERIKTLVDAKRDFEKKAFFRCWRHANSFTRGPLRNAGTGPGPRSVPNWY